MNYRTAPRTYQRENKRMKKYLRFLVCLILTIVLGLENIEPTTSDDTLILLREDSGQLFELEPQYHTYSEVVSELSQIQSDHPEIARVFSLGTSYEGRDIPAIKISDNAPIEEDEPETIICALHHAREAVTVEVVMYIINYLSDNYGRDEKVTSLVDSTEIYIIPIVNPDGKVYDDSGGIMSEGGHWRKNRQPCSGGMGTDLNRNYSYHWGGPGSSSCCSDVESYRGMSPFDAPETRAVKTFVEAHPDITVFLDYHSYGGIVLWPWGYTLDPIPDLEDRQVHEIIGTHYASITQYRPMQGSDLYLTSGNAMDWVYGTTQYRDTPIFSWAVETGEDFYPPPWELSRMCEKNCEAALYVLAYADDPYRVLRLWKASRAEDAGETWYYTQYDDSGWSTITAGEYSYDFYRHVFTCYNDTQQVLLDCAGLDTTLYVNGESVEGEYKKECRPGFIDITPFVRVGRNLVAVHVKNPGIFRMRVIQSTEMYDDKTWKVHSGESNEKWYTKEYDDSDWEAITLPDNRTYAFYRRTFTVPAYTQVLLNSTPSGSIYVNGVLVEQNPENSGSEFGYLDVTQYTTEGDNVIAVQANSPFDMTIIRKKVLPDLCITDQDIVFSNPHPSRGDTVTISVRVHSPQVNIPQAVLRFYDGNPNWGGTLIQELRTAIPVNLSLFHCTWLYPGGAHSICVVVDEDNEISELKEFNNVGCALLPVSNFDSWPMFRHGPERDGVSLLKGGMTEVSEKWRFKTGGTVGSPSVEDIDDDGEMEIVFGSQDHKIYAVNSDGTLLWSFETGGPVLCSAAIADVDTDGRMEIVCGSKDYLYVLKGKDGRVKWKFRTKGKISSPTVADVDGDEKMEIIFGSYGYVYSLNGEDGRVQWKFGTETFTFLSPAVGDMKGLRTLEVVISSENGVSVLSDSGFMLAWATLCSRDVRSSPSIGDINGDGRTEIVVGDGEGRIYAVNDDGSILWEVVVGGSINSSPAVGDLDEDGDTEVIIGAGEKVCALKGEDGSLFWSFESGGLIVSSPAAADIDGDSEYEIVVGSEEYVYALNDDGTLLWKYRTGGVASSPAIADVDSDGQAEIVVGSDSYVCVLDSQTEAGRTVILPEREILPWWILLVVLLAISTVAIIYFLISAGVERSYAAPASRSLQRGW